MTHCANCWEASNALEISVLRLVPYPEGVRGSHTDWATIIANHPSLRKSNWRYPASFAPEMRIVVFFNVISLGRNRANV